MGGRPKTQEKEGKKKVSVAKIAGWWGLAKAKLGGQSEIAVKPVKRAVKPIRDSGEANQAKLEGQLEITVKPMRTL